ncbi:hypothetical protein DFR46_0746 [Parasphingopyxis lamellibrachiae]|uniref:Uncharacterized protein n=1 Tax=Parasphingopyxis lamellibrachiae TaxID=680125 RepID=A0A3D9FDB1_9SPHN|nr:hypothetical protein [Parasphingopyxis lamellibrachiae]RED15743.1 hypothetical protein DFR46_0746 [Parasphingopyxis lamellibrachiae]
MWKRVGRLFVIKNRFEAYLIIYALAVGATARAQLYLVQYPGYAGELLALCCTGAVFLGGAKILDATPKKRSRHRQRLLVDRWRTRS